MTEQSGNQRRDGSDVAPSRGPSNTRNYADVNAVPAGATVAERTRTRLAALSGSELKVGRALLAAYPSAGLETVAELAARARVSAPTVLRFTARIGFSSYPVFQQALIREVQEQMGSPLRQLTANREQVGADTLLPAASRTYRDGLSETFGSLPEAELARAVALLGDVRLRIHPLGGRFSRVLATYLTTHLVLMRKDVDPVPDGELERITALMDLGRRDVLVVFDYRRYDDAVIEYAQRASSRGAHIVLFTDPWMSPAADVAEVVLPARVEAPSAFDSLVAPMAVVETVIAALAQGRKSQVHQRLSEIEELRPSLTGPQ